MRRVITKGLLVVGIVVVGASLMFRTQRWLSTPTSEVQVSARSLDFGTQWAQESFPWQLQVENSAPHAIELQLASSCKCTSLEPSLLVIPARETRDVQLTLDLRPSPSSEITQFSQPFKVDVLAIGRATNRQFKQLWTINGRVQHLLSRAPDNIEFGHQYETKGAKRTVRMDTLADAGVTKYDVDSSENVEVICRRYDTDNESGLEVEVALTHNLPAGMFAEEIRIVPRKGVTTLPSFNVIATGVVHDQVEASPDIISMGSLRHGESKRSVIALHFHGTKPSRIEIGELREKEIHIRRLVEVENPPNSVLFNVEVIPTHVGYTEDTITFAVYTSENETPRRIDVPVSFLAVGK